MESDHDIRRVCFIAALLPLLFGAFTLFEPFGRDQGIHATIAYALQEGLATYRDVYNIKPPMTTATHWLALELFGHSYHAIRILDLIFVSAGLASLSGSVLLLGGSRALALGASVGFASLFYVMGYWEHAQTDGWATIWLIFALNFTALGWNETPGHRRSLLFAFAGFAMGLAFCYKYTIGTVGLLVFAPLLVPGREVRFHWRDLFWLVIGGLTCLVLVFGFLAATGVLDPFLEIQSYIRGYLSYSRTIPSIITHYAVLTWTSSVGNAALIALGALAFLVTAIQRWTLLHVVTLVMIVTGMISAIAQGKGFPYHYLPVYTGAALLIGFGIEALTSALMRSRALARRRGLVWAVFILGIGLACGALYPNLKRVALVATGKISPRDIAMAYDNESDYSFADLLAFSEQFAEIRQPGETFFLWGYETGLYFLMEQPPLHRYPYSWPFVVRFHDGRYTPDLRARLEADPPDYIVIQSSDATPWVTANPDDSRAFLPKLPQINDFVTDGYAPMLEAERFDLWKRKM